MSPTKVIFTYKRKRLSSCSTADHAEACRADAQADKVQDDNNGRSESREKDLKYFNCVTCGNVDLLRNCKNCMKPYDYDCSGSCFKPTLLSENSSPALSSQVQMSKSFNSSENNHVEEAHAASTRELMPGSNEFPEENKSMASSEPVSASRGKTNNSSEKDMNSCFEHVGGCTLGPSTSQSTEKDTDSPSIESFLHNFGTGKPKVATPLLTFSRRLKRKTNAGNEVMYTELPPRENSTVIKDSKSMSFPPGYCEVIADKGQHLEESVDLKVGNKDPNKWKNLCQTVDKVLVNDNFLDSTDHSREKDCFKENLNVGASSVIENSANGTMGSIAPSSLDEVETRNFIKENARCSLNDGTGVSFRYGTVRTDNSLVSPQFRASSGDSQFNTSDASISKTSARTAVGLKVSSGASVIDCNVIPECDMQDQASNTLIHSSSMVGTQGINIQEGLLKDNGIELFGYVGERAGNSPLQLRRDAHTSVGGLEAEPKSKCMQLFPEDTKSNLFTPASTDSEVRSKADRNTSFDLDSGGDVLRCSSNKFSDFLGLSLPTEPLHGQTLKHGSYVQQFQECNARPREFIQSSGVSFSFPDNVSIFRHRMLLENINTKETGRRGNRNISLDKFEPCLPSMWTEEELDSLWIGIRRHGRGNWHAMLLDSRLRFAPWRVARDLASQWEQEQYKLINDQNMPQDRCLKPPDPYHVEGDGELCHRSGHLRRNVLADTQLSLGDVYGKKNSNYIRSGAQSYEFNHPPKRVRMSGNNKVGKYCCDLLNKLQNNVMVRDDDGPRPMESATTSLNLALSQMGAPWLVHPFQEPSATLHRPRNTITNTNVIVIDSDVSSEETISDEHSIKC